VAPLPAVPSTPTAMRGEALDLPSNKQACCIIIVKCLWVQQGIGKGARSASSLETCWQRLEGTEATIWRKEIIHRCNKNAGYEWI